MSELEAELEGVRARVLESQAAETAPADSRDAEWAAAVAENDRILTEIIALKVRVLLPTATDKAHSLDVSCFPATHACHCAINPVRLFLRDTFT